MEQQRKELFKEKVAVGGLTYYFDVKESVKGTKYLTINQAKRVGDKNEYSKIIIFENQFPAFTEGFKKVYEFLKPTEAATA
jgi:hypothetical protein